MITRPVTEFEPNPFGCSAAGHRCHFCGEFLQNPAVMWSGNDGQTIYLHGLCVETWTLRLLRDALELKYHGKPCWNQLEPKRHDVA